MKKFIYLFVAVASFWSCSLDSNTSMDSNIQYEIAKITSYDLPESFTHGSQYTINVDYLLASGCSVYDGLYANYKSDSFDGRRQIYVSAYSKVSNSSCDDTTAGAEGTDDLKITISENGTYTFYFLQAEVNGEPVYDIVEVPVNDIVTGT